MATLDTQLCSPEERALSVRPGALIHCLPRNESIALAFCTLSATLSLCACVVTFALILRNIRYHAKRTPGRWRLIKGPMDIYLISLFAGETLLSFGAVINGKWVRDGKLQIGGWCVAQGIILSAGSITAASSILAIAIHTFVMVWCNKGFHAIKLAYFVISLPWLYAIIYLSTISSVHRTGQDILFRPAPYWCWINKKYMVHRVFAVYLWLWTSIFVSILLYVPLFFWGRGNITIGDGFWNFKIHKRRAVRAPDGLRRHALHMIAYPLVFAVLVVPLSVGRWIGFVQESHGDRKNHVPPMALIAVETIYKFSGVANVMLFLLTRPTLLLFDRDTHSLGDNPAGNPPTYDGDVDSIEGHGERQVVDVSRNDNYEKYHPGQSAFRA